MSAPPEPEVEHTASSLPGGGPVSRWSPSRVPSPTAWIWFGLVVLCPVLGVTAWLGATGSGGDVDTAVWIILGVGMVWILALAGTGVGIGAARDVLVIDDVRHHAVGPRLSVRPGRTGVVADVELDGETLAELRDVTGSRSGRKKRRSSGGPRRVLRVDGVEYELYRRGGRRPEVFLRAEDGTVARARGYAHRRLRDWEFEAGERLFRLRLDVRRNPPRRTLLDDEGRAWRVTHTKGSVELQLPDEMKRIGAAAVAVLLHDVDVRARELATRLQVAKGDGEGGADLTDTWGSDSGSDGSSGGSDGSPGGSDGASGGGSDGGTP